MKVYIYHGDITKIKTDAIVNTANPTLLGGNGLDNEIHMAAGPKLLEACKKLKGCNYGDVKITKGFNLPAKWIMHAVGPRWDLHQPAAETLLQSVYNKCFELAEIQDIKSISFPSISTEVYGYPFEMACKVVYDLLQKIETSVEDVVLTFKKNNDYLLALTIFEKYITNRIKIEFI